MRWLRPIFVLFALLLVLSSGIVWLGLALTGQRFGQVMRRA